MRIRRRSVATLDALLLAALASLASPALAQSSIGPPENPNARGQAALDRIGASLPNVAQAYGLSVAELRSMFLNDPTLAVDPGLELLYLDVRPPLEAPANLGVDPESASAVPPTTGPEFQLESLPGAEKTIYLDFDGHVTEGTTWNGASGNASIVTGPYNIDGDPNSWSAEELRRIRDSWAVAAEDFAPWNINVTTKEPPVDDLRRTSSTDTRWGARVVITPDDWSNCGCGGHAYIGSFDDSVDEPTFVYNSGFRGVSEAISHEVGHMMNLAHDGTTSGAAYYQGHQGSGEPSWAPIMGVAYYVEVGQWSQQEYFGANNTGSGANYGNGEDDIAVIGSLTNGNGFGLRADDHGDVGSPTALIGGTPAVEGIISSRADVDAFSFTTTGGQVSLSAQGRVEGSNLDIELTLRDSQGAVVAADNPLGSLDASLSATVGSGTYVVTVDGVGVGSPTANPPTGYSDYASLGQFTLSGTIDGVAPPDVTPPPATTGLAATGDGSGVDLTWAPNTNPDGDVASYLVQRSAVSGGPYLTIGTVPFGTESFADTNPQVGDNVYVVVARDVSGNESVPSNEAVVTVEPSLDSVANAETPVYGTVTGSFTLTHVADGNGQLLVEAESGGKPSNRHDRLEHRWSIPASSGNQTLRVVATATDGGDADSGFVFEYSTDGTVWFPATTVAPGSMVDATVSLGGPSGTVLVRVVDTDRTSRERSFDSVEVDLLVVTGDGGPVDPPPDPSEAIALISVGTQGAGRGQQYGTATVTVIDDLGNPVSGAAVDVVFSGTFNETVTGSTGTDGTVTVRTSTTAKKPSVAACIRNLTAGALMWRPGSEACTP